MQKVIKLSPDDKLHIIESNEIDAEQWDREKWSRDNPMDYIKAVKVLNSYPSDMASYLFKDIFKITRLHIPEVLYKFYSVTDDCKLNNLKLETLSKKKVYLSELSQFNDPFDGRAIFYDPKRLTNFTELRKHGGKLINDFASYHLGTSLSATDYMNMPMWAHYSNNHKGYCVSYKTSENPNINTFAFPIQYIDARIDITDYMTRFVEYALTEKEKQQAQENKIT